MKNNKRSLHANNNWSVKETYLQNPQQNVYKQYT